jgi:pimeloyl-ACP methyl ester carboxylesterase
VRCRPSAADQLVDGLIHDRAGGSTACQDEAMPSFDRDDVHLHYEESGTGFPVLLIAPGGMRSAGATWKNAPWNPVDELSPQYRVIVMDQRNAGGSSAPISGDDGWATYTGDQLALLDHLGIDRCHVLGMCIGGAYILSLLRTAPQRVAAAVFLQPIGLHDNREAFHEIFDGWRAEQAPSHPETTDADWARFRANMYGGDHVLWSVPTSDVASMTTPMLVLMGDDLYHPQTASRTLVDTAPNASLVPRWKQPQDQPAARRAVAEFLAAHTPR